MVRKPAGTPGRNRERSAERSTECSADAGALRADNPAERAAKIREVAARLRKGFYSTAAVDDDITDKLSRAFGGLVV